MCSERGSVAAELVLVTPLLILFLVFVVGLGRLVNTRLDVDNAAAQAARAASLTSDAGLATTAAQSSVTTALGSDESCTHRNVVVDTSNFIPGGTVTVTVTCSVPLSDLVGLHLPSTETVSSRFVEPLDRYGQISG